jgi:outer membrane protein assembly factor BamB
MVERGWTISYPLPVPSPLNRIRFITLLLPPLGLVMLWRSREVKPRRKIFGTLGVLLYSLVYAALVIFLLIKFTGLEIEWRGGFPPVLTWSKTKPNYDAVEAHRIRQTNQALPSFPKTSAGAYWTDFRGPNRDGHYTEQAILTHWPPGGLRLLWRQPVGGGYASFVIAEGRVFTIEQRRNNEAVVAYDVETGRELWAHTYHAAFSEAMGGEGPRATPTWHQGRVYSMGAEGEFRVLEAATGRLLWHKDIFREFQATNCYFGMAASPLIADDKVIVLSGGLDQGRGAPTNRTVLAFDKVTGRLIWSALPDKMAYASPMLVTLSGERQLLIVSATRVVGLRPEDGALLWEFAWHVQYDNSITQPVLVGTNRLIIAGGYGAGCALIEVTRDVAGLRARQVWKNQNLKTKFNSAVFWNGFVYGLDEGILICLDPETGQRRWKDGRYSYGQLLLASGHLIMLSGEGDLALVKATPEAHAELARFSAIKGKTWNHPAIAGGRLLVRNAVEMACFEIAP